MTHSGSTKRNPSEHLERVDVELVHVGDQDIRRDLRNVDDVQTRKSREGRAPGRFKAASSNGISAGSMAANTGPGHEHNAFSGDGASTSVRQADFPSRILTLSYVIHKEPNPA